MVQYESCTVVTYDQVPHSNYRYNHGKESMNNEPSQVSLLKFSATWCGPCKLLSTNLQKILTEFPLVTLREIDVDDAPERAKKYAIKSVPTVIVLRDGIEINRLVGAQKISTLRAAMQLAQQTGNALFQGEDHFPAFGTSGRQSQTNQVVRLNVLPTT